jgi:hypothetical protein
VCFFSGSSSGKQPIASEADGHARGSQHFLEGGERDVGGGEGMAGEHRRRFREHHLR